MLTLATGAGIYLWQKRDDPLDVPVAWQPQHQSFLEAPMRLRPVPGWRLSVTDLGLPEGSRIVTDPMQIHSDPLVGNIGERAFLLTQSPDAPTTRWWLAAADVASGRRLFPPIPLNSGGKPECFLNGPEAVLCITSELTDRTAWVIDSRSGAVTYSGPTDLNVRPNELNVQRVGIYAVAASEHQGVYGVGPTAQTTWFVPGAGNVTPKYLNSLDIALPTLTWIFRE